MPDLQHVPVLATEVIEGLKPRPGGVFVDGTVGGGGHARLLLAQLMPGGRLIAIDQDADTLSRARSRLDKFGDAVLFVHDNFRNLRMILDGLGVAAVDGVVLDVGVSSFQLDEPARGFTYQHDAPLDMRMDVRSKVTAQHLVNELPFEQLVRLLRDYGEERHAARIARAIVAERQRTALRTSGQLVDVIKKAVPARDRRRGPHPARRTFQALRIVVNDELGALEEGLRAGVAALKPGGRIAVISFHSLEDRIVKRIFTELAADCECPPELPVCRCNRRPSVRIVTRKPIVPDEDEVANNPRARSARLRVAERVGLLGGEGE